MVSSQKTDILDSNFDLHRKWCGILNENACGNQKYQVNYVCGASHRFAYFGLNLTPQEVPAQCFRRYLDWNFLVLSDMSYG